MKTAFLLLVICQVAFAADTNIIPFLTVGEQTFTNVEIGTVTASHVTLFYDGGGQRVAISNLPTYLQKRFNYDPTKAALKGKENVARSGTSLASTNPAEIILARHLNSDFTVEKAIHWKPANINHPADDDAIHIALLDGGWDKLARKLTSATNAANDYTEEFEKVAKASEDGAIAHIKLQQAEGLIISVEADSQIAHKKLDDEIAKQNRENMKDEARAKLLLEAARIGTDEEKQIREYLKQGGPQGAEDLGYILVLTVDPIGFEFTAYAYKQNEFGSLGHIKFKHGQEAIAGEVFAKFLEWEAAAAKSDAETFEKPLARYPEPGSLLIRTFTFQWNSAGGNSADTSIGKRGVLLAGTDVKWDQAYSMPTNKDDTNQFGANLGAIGYGLHFYGSFDRIEVANFQKLMKSLPDLKQALAEKLKRKDTQTDIFK